MINNTFKLTHLCPPQKIRKVSILQNVDKQKSAASQDSCFWYLITGRRVGKEHQINYSQNNIIIYGNQISYVNLYFPMNLFWKGGLFNKLMAGGRSKIYSSILKRYERQNNQYIKCRPYLACDLNKSKVKRYL